MSPSLTLPTSFATGEVVLRLPTSEDVDRVTEICQDPDIQRFTRVPSPYRRDDAETFVALAHRALAEGDGAHLVVEGAGTIVGAVGVGIHRGDGVGSVGYWTSPESRRRGVTTNAVRRLCAWCFDDVHLPRLELDAAATNPGSNALAARLGFTLEGRRRSAFPLVAVGGRDAERVDLNVWGLLPGELR